MTIASTAMNSRPTPQKNVQRAFDRAAQRYYDHCYALNRESLQQQSAGLLLQQLYRQHQPMAGGVKQLLDLGCGMGVHWPKLKALSEYYTGVDLSAQMISQARLRYPGEHSCTRWIVGDAQALPLQSGFAERVFSNLALQWCADRQAVANELYRVSKPGGVVHFSTLVAGSLTPLEHLVELGLLPVLNNYPAAAKWQQHLLQAGFTQVQWQQVEVATFHNSGTDLLRSMKNIGASQRQTHSPNRAAQGLRTPHWLQQVNAELERYRQPQGIPLNYQVALVSATKGSSKHLHL